jgi:DHA1 family tetracycline resistance protein-like MFS transporter
MPSLISVTAIVAPWTMTELFGYFASGEASVYFPGAPFLLATLLVIAALARFGWSARDTRLTEEAAP